MLTGSTLSAASACLRLSSCIVSLICWTQPIDSPVSTVSPRVTRFLNAAEPRCAGLRARQSRSRPVSLAAAAVLSRFRPKWEWTVRMLIYKWVVWARRCGRGATMATGFPH